MAEGSGEAVAVPASGAANGLSNGAGGTSAQPNNPLSRKLHKILETRLDNDKVTGPGTRVARAAAPRPSVRHPVPRREGDGGGGEEPGKGKRFPGCHS